MHTHAHTNEPSRSESALKWAFFIIFGFMLVEAAGGIISGSLALLADAGHMLTDAFALAMAWLAFIAGRKPPDDQHSYGHQRYQVIAAFLNGIFLIAIVLWILFEALDRFQNPQAIDVPIMLIVATLGLIVNIITFKMLHSGEQDNLNVRGALLHVLSDLLGSVAAIIAGVVIYYFNWLWMDPALSLVVALLITRSGVMLIKDSIHILLEGVPEHIDVDQVKLHLEQQFPEIDNIHHVHTWSLNNEEVLMTLHVKVSELNCVDELLKRVHHELEHIFNVTHATVQIEKEYCSSQLEKV
ncbi:cation diffusion facilitator family transporter [Pleionea mediterranea]|uniref:Cobalt-zinc-cadmium efflux system protein n=1 Tax=Pleionea mediterranea TaxID=523701 RepID=A0A316FEQ7_9GAMM|nr:cation diffusion facilitator family transporter [Pleionea mediterranea]PWK47368.1 cobalt-zinc-cadmium efflux system protein [Pleionea mediterranea]